MPKITQTQHTKTTHARNSHTQDTNIQNIRTQNTHTQHARTQKSHTQSMQDIDEESAIEILDLLCVALHFAGVKQECIEKALQLYSKEIDNFDENASYGQKEIIQIILTLRKKYKDLFQ